VHSHLVPEPAILGAQRTLWQELRLAVEPAAALPLAALQAGLVLPGPGERVALVICGANLDPATLAG
jgi:threonine dehydratase